MKKLMICLFVLFWLSGASSVFAGEQLANVVWNTNVFAGYDSNNGNALFANKIDLDIGLTDYYYTVNGVLMMTNNKWLPCTGTGYTTSENTVFLGLTCGTSNVSLNVNNNTLNGTISLINDNMSIDSGYVTLQGVY